MVCSKCKKESICQSCAMPLNNKTAAGTNTDGSKCLDYCQFCFKDGKFTEPDLTKEGMCKKVETVMKKMSFKQEKIDEVIELLSSLKRWK